MENSAKEELLEKLGLSELNSEELEKVFGGTDIDTTKIDEECMHKCLKSFKDLYKCMKQCAID